jgi:2-polyprenyl-6-methoxyphenol hydroxylase-like FAD-dependent oxidoreductase
MVRARNVQPILIVGGGIGGFAAALALSRKGFRVQLLEQASRFAEIGAGIQLGPNVFRMFDELGVTDAVKRLAVFPENLIMMDCITAREVTRIPLGPAFLERFGQPYAVIHRADLHSVLVNACRQAELINLQASTKVASFEDTGDGVGVMAENGRTFRGAALIGADGIWSMIRSQLLGDGKPVVSGHIAYRAVLPTSEMPERLRWHSMTIWAGEKTHLVHYPLRVGELFNLVAVFHSDRFTEGWDAFGDVQELHERFAGTCEEVRTLLQKIESWRMWVLCDRAPIKEWSRGRVTLLGDAAHPMLQYLAQGANLAIEDAVCLADQLDREEGDFAAAARAYQSLRYLRTGRMQMMARLYGEVYHASGVVREVRNHVLGERTPEQAYESMAWIYDYAAPVAPSREATQTAPARSDPPPQEERHP